MKVKYIIHSCFLIEIEGKVLLFDYPSGRFAKEDIRERVVDTIRGAQLFIFVTHSHSDHYSSEIFEFDRYASETRYIVSSDVDLTMVSDEKNILIVEPEKKYKVNNLEVKTFKSNDQGVAYLLTISDKTIYFGGDLARWDWPEWSQSKRRSMIDEFEDVLGNLEEIDLDVAFSNMDERLESWAGPVDFINRVKPDYFVPIHTFGNEEWIDDLLSKDLAERTKIFKYRKTGDNLTIK